MTPERVDEIYADLESMVVELHSDPASLGPLYLQDLIAKTRGYLNRVSLLMQEVGREALALTRQLDSYEVAYQASYDELLVEDEEVRNLPSIEDRRAKINLILKDDRKHINKTKKALKELGFVEKAVKHRYKDLESTVSSIRMQKSLIDVDTRTGAYHGDDTDTSRGTTTARPRKAVFAGGDPFASDDEVLKFLDEAVNAAPKPPKKDFETESLLNEIVVSDSDTDTEEEKLMRRFLESDEFDDLFETLA